MGFVCSDSCENYMTRENVHAKCSSESPFSEYLGFHIYCYPPSPLVLGQTRRSTGLLSLVILNVFRLFVITIPSACRLPLLCLPQMLHSPGFRNLCPILLTTRPLLLSSILRNLSHLSIHIPKVRHRPGVHFRRRCSDFLVVFPFCFHWRCSSCIL